MLFKYIKNSLKLLITFTFIFSIIGCSSVDETLSNIERRGYEDSSRLVSTEWLADNINDENLVIIDVRKKEQYDEGHIPGAVHLTPGEVFQQEIDGVKGMLPSADHIAKHLSAIGAKPDSTILIYDGIKNLWATRGLWALDVYGHKNTILLDGVWTKWSAEGREISTTPPTVKASSYKFSGSPNTSIIAGWEEVLASVGDPSKLVCDTRTAEEYSGKDARADRGGHIPESVHLEWVKSNNDNHEFIEASQLQSIYDEAGLTEGKTIYTLCQTAVRAAHTYFVLHDLLGYDNVKVYDGSWIEWGNNQELPLETGG